jgi:hypothetical protein
LHLYVFFDVPVVLERARQAMQGELARLHEKHPDLARRVADWNEHLKASSPGTKWRVCQINELEIYPDEAHGFRIIGTRGKVVLADREIGTAKWGVFTRGRRKGEDIVGFDLVSWWRAMQSGERMPLDEVLRIIETRLPGPIDRFVVDLVGRRADVDVDLTSLPELSSETGVLETPVEGIVRELPDVPPERPQSGSLRRQTRRKITGYWLGTLNPPGWFDTAVLVTARLVRAEGLAQAETVALLRRYAREIPEGARSCSKRLVSGDWARVDRDIAKSVSNAYGDDKPHDGARSDAELDRTIRAWARHGFRMSDKATWGLPATAPPDDVQVEWTEGDRRDIGLYLGRALKIDDAGLAVKVATAVVQLTVAKEKAERGWGYEYLRKWLPDNFGIACSKREKQAAVCRALVDLGIIKVLYPGRLGHATRWTFGARVVARMAGDMGDDWKIVEDEEVARERRDRRARLFMPC